ncbi:MAG TPA: hypothetical protein ENJ54_09800 [Chloroflexi bacterium]|nr:hypothetical protein [Chloroflexota bacterium]
MLDSKILDFARKWAKKASPAYAKRAVSVEPIVIKGEPWALVTAAGLEGTLYLGVPHAQINPAVFDADKLPKFPKGGSLVVEEGKKAFIVKGNARIPLPVLGEEDAKFYNLPPMPQETEGDFEEVVVAAEDVAEVAAFRSPDDARPALQTLGFHPNGMFGASDGYQLGVAKILSGEVSPVAEWSNGEVQIMAPELPQAFFGLVVKKAEGKMRFRFVKKPEGAFVPQVRGWLRLDKKVAPVFFMVQGTGYHKYPDFAQILEGKREVFGTIDVPKDALGLLKLADRGYLLTDDEGAIHLVAEAEDEDGRPQIVAVLPVGETTTEAAFMAAYNAAFLRKGFAFLPQGEVSADTNYVSPASPLQISKGEKVYLVMPLRVVSFAGSDKDLVENTCRVLNAANDWGVKVDKLLSMLPVLDIPAEDETAFEAVAVPA